MLTIISLLKIVLEQLLGSAVFTSVVAGTVYLVDIGSECVNTATHVLQIERCVHCAPVLVLCRW